MKRTDQDSWESLINENRGGFDSKMPADIWSNIEKELPREKESKKVFKLWQVYKYAALFIVALGIGYLAMYLHFTTPQHTSDNQLPIQNNSESNEIQSSYYNELAEVETYYSSEIEDKLEVVKTLEDSESIIEELNLLQEEFEELKTEMGGHINEEKIVRAMIQNYRIRLELLKGILEELHPDASKQKRRNYGNDNI